MAPRDTARIPPAAPPARADDPTEAQWRGLPVSFLRGLAAVTALAVAVRVGFIFGTYQHHSLTGDAWVYHQEARFVASGRGFVNPISWSFTGIVTQAADHPPLYIVVLALAHALGIRSIVGQLLLNGLFGVATVVVLALIGRRLGGTRVGLVAGVIGALYPGLWSWNGQLLSESLSVLTATLVLFCCYRYLDGRARRDLILLAVSIGFACLARSEQVLLVPLLAVPLLVSTYRSTLDRSRLGRDLVVVLAIVAVVLAPWTAFNLTRFKQPVLLGTGFGRALDSGSCGGPWHGPERLGWWALDCLETPMDVPRLNQLRFDESQMDKLYRDDAIRTMRRDPVRVPIVMSARVGRMFQLYDPLTQLDLDQETESRDPWVSTSAWSTFYLLAIAAVPGGIALRRRLRLVFPLVVPIVVALLGAVIAFGTTRYRAPAEPALVVLAAFGFVWGCDLVERRLRGGRAAALADPGPAASTRRLTATLVATAVLVVAVGGLGYAFASATNHTRFGPAGPDATWVAPPLPPG